MAKTCYFHLLSALLLFPILCHAQQIKKVKNNSSTFRLPAHASFLPGKIIVKINNSLRSSCRAEEIEDPTLERLFESLHIESVRKAFPNISVPTNSRNQYGEQMVDLSLIYTLSYPVFYDIEEIINAILDEESIEYAEPWYLNEVFYLPNDLMVDTTGGAPGQWSLQQIQAAEGWDIQRNNESVIVGVIDTGISFEHEDLKDNLAYNLNDPIDGIDNDLDGFVDNYRGWDLGGALFGGLGDNDPTYSTSSHGVAVTGILGATADNEVGTAGVCFNCKFLPIKGSSDDLPNSISYGYHGIVYAVEHGAEIVNCSWGSNRRTQFGEDVVNYATINRKAAIIAAAGNSESDEKFYPAAFDRVISVANTAQGDTLCCNSTYNYSVSISAPGNRLAGPIDHSGYSPSLNGTSFAAPFAAGVVAVVKAYFPQYSGFQAAQHVRVNTDNIYEMNPDRIDKMGTGRVNMFRALTATPKPSIRKTSFSVLDLDGDLRFETGDTLMIFMDFVNYLEKTDNLNIQIVSPEPDNQLYIEIHSDNYAAGSIQTYQQFSNERLPFMLSIREGIPLDFEVILKIKYTDPATAYQDFEYLTFRVNKSYLNILENKLYTTITSKGNFGFNDFGDNEEGLGIMYQGNENTLFEGGFLVGLPSGQVSDNIRNNQNTQDGDFETITQAYQIQNSQKADFEALAVLGDNPAPDPIGLKITHHIYAYKDIKDEDYIIFQYIIYNAGSTPLNDLYAGLFADWDIADLSKNASNYDLNEKMVFAYDLLGIDRNFYALSLISEHDFRAFATTNPSAFTYSDMEKFTALSNIPTSETATAGISTGGADVMHFISAGPLSIAAGDSQKIAFALLAGGNYVNLQASRKLAADKYRCIILEQGPTAGFSIANQSLQVGTPISFVDNNSYTSSWYWDFGDGNTSSEQYPQHTYSSPGNYRVEFTASDGNCEVKRSQTLLINMSTSLNRSLDKNFSIFPNPTPSRISINLISQWKGELSIQVINLHGQQIFHTKSTKNKEDWTYRLSLEGMPKGIYELQLIGKGLVYNQKIIKI